MHVIDHTIITNTNQLNRVISYWRQRFGLRKEFGLLVSKIGGIDKLCAILCSYAKIDPINCENLDP